MTLGGFADELRPRGVSVLSIPPHADRHTAAPTSSVLGDEALRFDRVEIEGILVGNFIGKWQDPRRPSARLAAGRGCMLFASFSVGMTTETCGREGGLPALISAGSAPISAAK
jgi:hypothetical protein